MIAGQKSLSSIAREIFDETLESIDAGEAVRRAVRVEDKKLYVCDSVYDLTKTPYIYSVAIGKAAKPMAKALTEVLGEQLVSGVVSAPDSEVKLSNHWQVFRGGHPVPNEESFQSARSARSLLDDVNDHDSSSVVIFLVSGGGSAMMELPRDEKIPLEDFQEASRILVTCGATIAEINTIRRRLSAIKGGGLDAMLKSNVERVTLLISDTNRGDEKNIASGPTIHVVVDNDVEKIIERYDLLSRLPSSVARALASDPPAGAGGTDFLHAPYYVLLSNDDAIEAAERAAQRKGFVVEKDFDFVETEIEEGCAGLVEKLLRLKQHHGKPVCIVSGGEFVCRVRGDGIGGRNNEAALRSAIHFSNVENMNIAALHAGTDGIDGNSPSAGAIADESTISRAKDLNFDADDFLARSDSYNFFKRLGDTIETGATGTNVRDIRILLANAEARTQ
jgi:hydroxypyruvate reductase